MDKPYISSRALSEAVYLILSAVDANVTWLMGLVVEDDTTPLPLLQNYNTCTSIFQDFPCSKFRGAAPHTPLMHISNIHTESTYSLQQQQQQHTLHHCVTGIVAEFLVIPAPGDFL